MAIVFTLEAIHGPLRRSRSSFVCFCITAEKRSYGMREEEGSGVVAGDRVDLAVVAAHAQRAVVADDRRV